MQWLSAPITAPNTTWKENLSLPDCEMVEPSTPLTLFLRYFPEEFFQMVVEKTNINALQNNYELKTNVIEIKKLFAMHIVMGSLNFPAVRMFWKAGTRIPLIADSMTSNRFFKLRNFLHVVDNQTDRNPADKLWKVRPIIQFFLKRCHELKLEEHLCVDEQMIPFTGTLEIKQFVKNKPNPWGIKVFLFCGSSGKIYDLIVYEGKTTQINEALQKEFGLGSAVVLMFANRIPEEMWYKLSFDNFFTSIPLLQQLSNKKIAAAGTIRRNRLLDDPLMSKSELAKHGRGFSQEKTLEDNSVTVVAWNDNRPVTLASNFIGVEKKVTVDRWSKKKKQFESVECPAIVQFYNKTMGGVDKVDHLMSLYRIFIRSRKWTLRVIFHFVDLAIVNSWLEYKQEAKKCKIPEKNQMTLLQFRNKIAEALARAQVKTPGPGRPPKNKQPPEELREKREYNAKRPCTDVRYDNFDHLPTVQNDPVRCKLEGCSGRTKFACMKCNVALCLQKDRNCFLCFHKKP